MTKSKSFKQLYKVYVGSNIDKVPNETNSVRHRGQMSPHLGGEYESA